MPHWARDADDDTVQHMKAIVLTFDSLPVSFLGCYGSQWVETPNFDRLAAGSIVFDQHFGEDFAPDAVTHAWWTGSYQFPRPPERHFGQIAICDMLREAGVKTRLLIVNSNSPSIPISGGWSGVFEVEETDRLDVDECETPFARMVSHAADAFHELASAGGDWLLWLKSRGVSSPDIPSGTSTTHFLESDDDDAIEFQWQRSRCASAVTLLDRGVGRLLDAIQERVGDENLLLIVTAAQGSVRNTHGDVPPGWARLSEEIVHTPLMLRTANVGMGSRRQQLTQSVDLLPTLLEWFGWELNRVPCEGRSLLPIVRGVESNDRDYVCLGDGVRARAIRTREWHLIKSADESGSADARPPKLFVKPDDIWEIHDVAAQSPAEAKALESILEQFVANARNSFPLVVPSLTQTAGNRTAQASRPIDGNFR